MSTWSTNATAYPRRSWLGRAEDWLDDRGKGAWIAAMVLGFVFVWPVGLALLGYMIWSKRMFSHSCGMTRGHRHEMHHQMREEMRKRWAHGPMAFRTSGNTAFDAYKSDTLDRLQREQEEFESFLTRLRASKDKAEFDQYMEDRARAARDTTGQDSTSGAASDAPGEGGATGRY